MKIDPYKHEAKYRAWKARTKDGIPGLRQADSDTIRRFISDMEMGLNTGRGARKGPRGHARLNTLNQKLAFLSRVLEQRYGRQSLLDVREEDLHDLFSAMRSGAFQKQGGGQYKSTADFVNVFRSFWHWHMKVQRKRGVTIPDICLDLDSSTRKPPWVYLTVDDVQKLCREATPKYRRLILFLFDSGARAPTELVNIRAGDLLEDCTKVRVQEDSSKTFGRTINLMLSADVLRDHVRDRDLGPDDQVFPISPGVANRYLKRLSGRLLGNKVSPAGKRYSQLTLYDLRHSSACYWLPRYKSESALKYRFGWRKSSMIHYYTELLGMKDTIAAEDLHLPSGRTALEKRLDQVETEKRLTEDRLNSLHREVREVLRVVERLAGGGTLGALGPPRDSCASPLISTHSSVG